MTAYVVRRSLQGAVVLWLATVVVFVIFFVGPHDAARAMAGRQASPEVVELVRQRLGLDRPVVEQYADFVARAVRGDFGVDYYTGDPVTAVIASAYPKTLSLVIGALVLWLGLGLLCGAITAARPRSRPDRALAAVSAVVISMPPFLVGILALYFAFYRLTLSGLSWFPPGGYVPFTESPMGWAHHLLLPWLTIALVLAAVYARLTRTWLLDALAADFVRTARSKGLRSRAVVYRHGLRSTLAPIVAQTGVDVGQLAGGVVVTESVFSIHGLGSVALDAVRDYNLPVITGIVLVSAAAVVVVGIIADVACAALDPRARVVRP